MLIRMRDLEAIAKGEITLAFRRWKRPTVKAGGTLRTPVGVLAIEALDPVSESEISEDEARCAGFASRDELMQALDTRSDAQIYRIELRLAGPDPRVELRNQSTLNAEDRAELDRRLARLDTASPQGPWTEITLRLIEKQPGTRAGDLAIDAGFETRWFKSKVRRLKELGLTESLEIGYRLSPRGRAYVEGTTDR